MLAALPVLQTVQAMESMTQLQTTEHKCYDTQDVPNSPVCLFCIIHSHCMYKHPLIVFKFGTIKKKDEKLNLYIYICMYKTLKKCSLKLDCVQLHTCMRSDCQVSHFIPFVTHIF